MPAAFTMQLLHAAMLLLVAAAARVTSTSAPPPRQLRQSSRSAASAASASAPSQPQRECLGRPDDAAGCLSTAIPPVHFSARPVPLHCLSHRLSPAYPLPFHCIPTPFRSCSRCVVHTPPRTPRDGRSAESLVGAEGNCSGGWQFGPPSPKTLEPCVCDPHR